MLATVYAEAGRLPEALAANLGRANHPKQPRAAVPHGTRAACHHHVDCHGVLGGPIQNRDR